MYVFLSYSSKDKQFAQKIAQDLKDSGIKIWLDEWEIRVGDSISQKIQQGLEDADFIAVLLTCHSVDSGWVQKEWQSKINEEIKDEKTVILPLKVEECKIPVLLKDKKYADFSRNYESAIQELIQTIKGNSPVKQKNSNIFKENVSKNINTLGQIKTNFPTLLLFSKKPSIQIEITNVSKEIWHGVKANSYVSFFINPKEKDKQLPEKMFYLKEMEEPILKPGDSMSMDVSGQTINYLQQINSALTNSTLSGFPNLFDFYFRPTIFFLNDEEQQKMSFKNLYFSQNNIASTTSSVLKEIKEIVLAKELLPNYSIFSIRGAVSAFIRYLVLFEGEAEQTQFKKLLMFDYGWTIDPKSQNFIQDFSFVSSGYDCGIDLLKKSYENFDKWKANQSSNVYLSKFDHDPKVDDAIVRISAKVISISGQRLEVFKFVPTGK
ncbi:MAG: toll/interleukin-1 receptor domain-containing protein [Desulfamplus sp.]|nr:toll/interleukin-1 receptor domain-containing protein [Desulfamplus sp.]